ncbi:UPF0496 protein 4-like [Magnolia sinica]|uniref:UPF0496 protein 4-like n=1 Tax=Magnolia sinica TaxID=86752 RepID=UPI00265988AD|nr:UPF0496 protein 4-like [Magnolia sinica]
MVKVFPSYFSGFFIKGKNQTSPLDEDARQFCSSLSKDIERLECSLVDGSISLRWSAEAMNVLKKMHFEFLLFVEKSRPPISSEGKDWLDQYMKESVMLLDFCNVLKSAVSRIERYRMVVEFTVRKLNDDDTSIETKKIEMERLERECKKNPAIIEKWGDARLDKIIWECNESKKGITPVMFAIKSTVMIITSLLFSAFISTATVDVGDREACRKFPQLGLFGSSLMTLVYRYRERIQTPKANSGMGLVEHEMVERAVDDLKAQIAGGMVEGREKVVRSVEVLNKRSVDLKESLQMFDSAVNGVFDEVIKGRNKLLGMFGSTYLI